jgi:hypothetical protein
MISKWQLDVDFEDFTETEQSRFCIQRIIKIGDCKPSKQWQRTNLQPNQPLATLRAINQAFKFPIALNNSSISHRLGASGHFKTIR